MKKIIIDTDMGVDDIVAINLLLDNSKIKVKTISTVFGVSNLITGTKNLARILTFLGKINVPICQGSNSPRQAENFPKIDRQRANNLTLLKNILLPQKPAKKIVIKKLNLKLNSPITLLCLGPLTNIAKIINQNLNYKKLIKRLVIMGGAIFSPGNVSPNWLTEYNIALDPDSAKIVFSSGLPITLIATDATKQVSATNKQFLKKVLAKNPQSPIGKIIKTIILNNRRDFNYFYDPLAAAILVEPKIISETKKITLSITPSGQTIGQINPKSNISLITKINRKLFYKYLLNSIN